MWREEDARLVECLVEDEGSKEFRSEGGAGFISCKRSRRSWLVRDRSSCPVTSHGGWSLRKQMAGAVTEQRQLAAKRTRQAFFLALTGSQAILRAATQARSLRQQGRTLHAVRTDWSMGRAFRLQRDQDQRRQVCRSMMSTTALPGHRRDSPACTTHVPAPRRAQLLSK